mmetsp:Transcript_115273/g.327000  ORF Transcript_115273/g.327000 Transcript_115273/m.327000 type:complete len:307 (+) Transcript_115273:715-1635(+)
MRAPEGDLIELFQVYLALLHRGQHAVQRLPVQLAANQPVLDEPPGSGACRSPVLQKSGLVERHRSGRVAEEVQRPQLNTLRGDRPHQLNGNWPAFARQRHRELDQRPVHVVHNGHQAWPQFPRRAGTIGVLLGRILGRAEEDVLQMRLPRDHEPHEHQHLHPGPSRAPLGREDGNLILANEGQVRPLERRPGGVGRQSVHPRVVPQAYAKVLQHLLLVRIVVAWAQRESGLLQSLVVEDCARQHGRALEVHRQMRGVQLQQRLRLLDVLGELSDSVLPDDVLGDVQLGNTVVASQPLLEEDEVVVV